MFFGIFQCSGILKECGYIVSLWAGEGKEADMSDGRRKMEKPMSSVSSPGHYPKPSNAEVR